MPIDISDFAKPQDDPSELPSSVASASWLLPSGVDDTAAINAAIAAGRQLGPGTFNISGLITGCPRGQGSKATVLLATNAAARIQHGPALGTAPVSSPGTVGGFLLNGATIAGTNAVPLFISNVVTANYADLAVVNSAGDGVGVYGQNCTFTQCAFGQSVHNDMTLDQGTGGHVFTRCEYTWAGNFALEIKQSAGIAAASSYAVPTNNYWYGCIFEVIGSSSAVVGSLHVTNGDNNIFSECQFACQAQAPQAVLIEQTGLAYGYPNFNMRTYFRNCAFNGGSASAIKSGMGALYGDYALILQGDNTFGANNLAIDWRSITPVRQDGTYYNSGNASMVFYTPSVNAGALQYGVVQTLTQKGLVGQSIALYHSGTLGNFPPGANQAVFTLFEIQLPQTVDVMALVVATAGGNLDLGIYDSTGTGGGPGARLTHSGSVACPASSAVGAAIAMPSVVLQPGRYWAAFVNDSGVASIQYGDVTLLAGITPPRYNQASAFPLPATAAATSDSSGSVYRIIPAKS